MPWKFRPPLCMICSNDFEKSGGHIVLCSHKEGVVHGGCCRDICSLDGKGHANCPHAKRVFEKKELLVR